MNVAEKTALTAGEILITGGGIVESLIGAWGMNEQLKVLREGNRIQRETALAAIQEKAKQRRSDYREFLQKQGLRKEALKEEMRQFDLTFGLEKERLAMTREQMGWAREERARAKQAGLAFTKALMARRKGGGAIAPAAGVVTRLAGRA